jgi:DNA-directed RNA polymerase subunit RPC12/RpoP
MNTASLTRKYCRMSPGHECALKESLKNYNSHCAPASLVPSVSVCVQAFRWLGMASKDLCAVCGKPFYRKQKTIRCGECDSRLHCSCLEPCVLETIVNASTGKSAYKCDSCKKLTGDSFSKSNQNEAISAELQCTASCIADKVSLSAQLETVRANGICTMEM